MALTSVVVALVTAAAGFGFPNVAAAGPFVVPHASYTSSGNLCAVCHKVHDAFSDRYLFSARAASTGELGVCYSCHDGNGASTNIKVGPLNSFSSASGHAVENTGNVSAADLTNVCSDCHTPHKDPATRLSLYASKVNGVTITAADNTWCLACHNDAQDWYVTKYGAYPALGAPILDATGYPVAGTFPGATVYTSAAKNAHIGIPASSGATTRVAGDCLYCHSSHRGVSRYDSLVATFQAPVSATLAADRATGDYAAVCFGCHDGSLAGATNVKQYVTFNGADDAAYSGHRIKSIDASLPVNAPLPCYECHNPHGSSRNNSRLISDARGQNLETASAPGVRRFCLTCHTTSDNRVWDSALSTYTPVPAGALIAGLPRDGGTPGSGPNFGKNWLLLKPLSGHAQADELTSCYTCHGSSYGAPDAGNNVHNPGPGVSPGGVDCYACHMVYKNPMEDGVGTAIGGTRTNFYHHILGGLLNATGTYKEGDYAPGVAGAYPTTTHGGADVFCVTCHVDHNKFNGTKAANLRNSALAGSPTASASDYNKTTGLGLCIVCHGTSYSKDTANAKSDGSTNTVRLNIDDYQVSAHQYEVTSTFNDGSVFAANCSKCHGGQDPKSYQSGAQFGVHYSSSRRVLSALGATQSDPLGSGFCYRCHSRTTDPLTGTKKAVAGRDIYGTKGATLSLASEYVWASFNGSMVSTHPVDSKLICENCHNPHASSATTLVADPDDTYRTMPYGTATERSTFCLRCHDGSAPAYTNEDPPYVPSTVSVTLAGANKSVYSPRGHWSTSGSISAAERVACGACHDNHGSKIVKLLGTFDGASGTNRINGAVLSANDNAVCYACHTAASTGFPNASRSAAGYPTDGTWPGSATYTTAYNAAAHTGNIHQSADWPVVSGGWGAGDCKNCHDVHGSANTYDELRTESAAGVPGTYGFSQADMSLCFNCHDGSPSADDIKSFYPASAGGTAAAGVTRSGHRTLSAGSLPAGSALPCYDCHNPHGSASAYGLQVVTQTAVGTTVTIGDAAGELVMTPSATAVDVRRFCFTCHTTGDAGVTQGWNGAAMAAVGAGAKVEGIDRTVYAAAGAHLKIPPVGGHYLADTDSCYKCHGSSYTAGASNVHSPSGGLSDGNQPCYGCHSAYQSPMEDGVGTKTGATRSASYHHVMGGALGDGDIAPFTGVYPTSQTDVYCVSCHTDHNYFNANKGANLRTDIAVTAGGTTTNSDYIASGTYGICVSCHTVSQTKQAPGTDQAALAGGAAATPKIPGAEFQVSAHDYNVASAYGASTFNANCSKCHSDEQTKEFQTSTYRFGTHWSASSGILRALGAFVTNPPHEEACYKCHNNTASRYGETLSAAAKNTQAEFAMTSKHDLTKVACVNCHNVHEASAAAPVADPSNTYSTASLATAADRANFCLTCHDGTTPSQTVNGTTLVPYTVTAAARANVATYYKTGGHGVGMPALASSSATTYAVTANDVTADWTNDANSLGSTTGNVASSPADNAFEMRHSFGAFDTATWTGVTAASVTVRSQAMPNGWGQSGTIPGGTFTPTIVPNNDSTRVGTWTYTSGTTGYNLVNDGPASDTTYITSPTNAVGSYLFTIPSPNVPAGATINSVNIFVRAMRDSWGTNNNLSRMTCNGTTASDSGAAFNPDRDFANYTRNWATKPGGGAWTVADVNNITAIGVDHTTNDNGTSFSSVELRISYTSAGGPYTNDDTWAIEYTTDGWATIGGAISAASATNEALQTDHTFNLLTGIITPANINQFQARIIGRTVGAADNAGTVEWDRSVLNITYDYDSAGGSGPGLDCRACHEQHGSSLVHLLSTTAGGQAVASYSDTADQRQCLACHRAGGTAGTANISRYYPAAAGGAAAAGMTRSGHRTKTAGTLAVDSALPCRSCHNPHGAAGSGYMLAVRTQVEAGVDTLIGDTAGELTMSDASQTPANAANTRRFCFSCHTTSDTSAGWNGSAMAVVPAGAQVVGISRTGGVLKLTVLPSGINGHKAADTHSCYLCHGDDFSADNSVNVHNPAAGESRGGIACYTCHTVYQDKMEDGLGTALGLNRTTSFHHVLGSAASQGDRFTYPTLTTDTRQNVYCLSCHVDHDKFSPFVVGTNQRSANLRAAFSDAAVTGVNSDWSLATGGVCIGCHSVRLDRDGANQKAETSSLYTPPITSTAYDASAHQYTALSTFTDGTAFNADCVKCHDSEIDGGGMERGASTTGFQTSSDKFSVHYSSARRLLAAWGIAVADPPTEERVCYACHSLPADGLKSTAGQDWYRTAVMNVPSQAILGLMSSTYRHSVASYSGIHRPSPDDETRTYISANKHVECADCHGVHAATTVRHTTGQTTLSGALTGAFGTTPTFSGTNWTAPTAYTAAGAATKEYQICFKCHSGYNTNVTTWGGAGSQSWTDQGLEFSTTNQSYHPVVAGLPVTDPGTNGSSRLQVNDMRTVAQGGEGWTIGSVMYCSDCHAQSSAGSLGPHGSAVKWLLKGPNQAWPYDTAANNGSNNNTLGTYRTYGERDTNLDTANGLFCRNCHVLNGTEHTRGDHNVPCVSCHIRVPHGGKVSRLQAGNGSASVYPGNLPARYTPNGEGLKPTSWWEADFHKQNGGSYGGRETCGINGGSCGGSHDGHQTNGEYW